jgi:hypothetical protein
MPLRCPNCGQPWTAEAATCASCGATFISSRAWRRERALAERDAVLNTLAGLALLAALAGWGLALSGNPRFVLWLAGAAVLLGAAGHTFARRRRLWHWGWVGLALGAALAVQRLF